MSTNPAFARRPGARTAPASARAAVLAALALAGAVGPAQAAVFKFSQGFSPVNNTTATDWSYWERPGAPGSEVLLTNGNVQFKIWKVSYLGTAGSTYGWNDPSTPNLIPLFFAHNNNVLWWGRGSCCGPVTLPVKAVFMHPGAAGLKAVLSFLVPPGSGGVTFTSGRIKGQITDVDYNGGDGVTWSIERNGVQIPGASGTLVSTSPSSLASAVLNYAFPVATGDRINIVVDANSNEFFDLTALAGQIQLN